MHGEQTAVDSHSLAKTFEAHAAMGHATQRLLRVLILRHGCKEVVGLLPFAVCHRNQRKEAHQARVL